MNRHSLGTEIAAICGEDEEQRAFLATLSTAAAMINAAIRNAEWAFNARANAVVAEALDDEAAMEEHVMAAYEYDERAAELAFSTAQKLAKLATLDNGELGMS